MPFKVVTVTETSVSTRQGVIALTIIGARENKNTTVRPFMFWGESAKAAGAIFGVGMKFDFGTMKNRTPHAIDNGDGTGSLKGLLVGMGL